MKSLWPILLVAVSLSVGAERRVINQGFPGENSAELDARLDSALAKAKPQFVAIFAGGNDALNDKKFLPPEETRRHLEAMVKRTESTGARVLLVTLHDPDVSRLMQRHKIEAYAGIPPLKRLARVNAIIAEVASRNHAEVVPFHQILQKAGGANADLSTDGVHLTAKGYGILAQAVRAKLPEQLPANVTILCFGDSLTYGIGVRPGGDAPETAQTYPAQLSVLLQ